MTTRWRIESEPFVVYLWLEIMMRNAIFICGLYNKSPKHVGLVNSSRKVFSLRSYNHDQGTTFFIALCWLRWLTMMINRGFFFFFLCGQVVLNILTISHHLSYASFETSFHIEAPFKA